MLEQLPGSTISVLTDDERATSYRAYWEQLLHDPDGAPPLHRQMDLKLLQLQPTTVLTMSLSDEVRGFYPGSVHGGILAAFADVAAATSLWNTCDGVTTVPVTTEMHLRYFRQPKGGPLTAEVQVVHQGQRLLSTDCIVTDAEGHVLLRASGTFAVQPVRR